MKKLTCRDFGGPCDTELTGDSFQEIGKKLSEPLHTVKTRHRRALAKLKSILLGS